MMSYHGTLRKMITTLGVEGMAGFRLPLAENVTVNLVSMLGQPMNMSYLGRIHCIHCGRKTSKSFSQGYCFPCMRKLARCDSCIVRPERCHFERGTCREPEWALENCFQPHVVYLANTSGLKVGITRKSQIPTRWIDQGATQALPMLEVDSRLLSGMIEVILKRHVSDRTQWQTMLKGVAEPLDLVKERDRLLSLCRHEIKAEDGTEESTMIQFLSDPKVCAIHYPVLQYPDKVKAFNMDKQPQVKGTLLGIKGQYLILDTGVINIRKYSGYEVELSVG